MKKVFVSIFLMLMFVIPQWNVKAISQLGEKNVSGIGKNNREMREPLEAKDIKIHKKKCSLPQKKTFKRLNEREACYSSRVR